MNKMLLCLTSAFLLLVGCSHEGKEHSNTNDETISKSYNTLINESKKIREEGKLEEYKKIAYSNSPFYSYIDFLIKNEGASQDRTSVDLSNFKVIKEGNIIGAAYITEHLVVEREGTDFDMETNYYYIFKKDNNEWKIYDYLPSTAVDNIDTVIEKYEKK